MSIQFLSEESVDFNDDTEDKSNNESSSNEIAVLCNGCYGGFSISEKAQELYKSYTGIDISSRPDCRTDPVLYRVYNELGSEFDGYHAKVYHKLIDKKYKDYIKIKEYDGAERIEIDYKKYKLDKITSLILSNHDNALYNEIVSILNS